MLRKSGWKLKTAILALLLSFIVLVGSSEPAKAQYTYVASEIIYKGGTTGVTGAQADDGIYENIFERPLYYAESLTESSTTSTSYVDKVALTFTPEPNSTYLIVASWLMQGSSTSYQAKAKLTRTTGTPKDFNELIYQPKDTTDYISGGAIGIDTFGDSPGPQTYKVQFCTNNASGTTRIKEAKIFAFRLSEGDFYAQNEARSTTTSTSWQDKTVLTFTSETADYLILASATADGSSTSYDFKVQLTIDGTAYNAVNIEPYNAGNRYLWAMIKKVSFTSGSHTIKIQYCSESTLATAGIAHARIVVLKLSNFSNYYYAENEARTTTTSTSYVDKVTLTSTPQAGYHLVLASAGIDVASTSYSAYVQLVKNGTSQGEMLIETQDTTTRGFTYFALKAESLSSVSTTWKIQYRAESSSYAAGIKDARVIVLELPLYLIDVRHNIVDIPTTDGYQLEIEYYLVGDTEEVSVYLYNFSTNSWDNIGNLSSPVPETFVYVLEPKYISSGVVSVRYVQPDRDTTQTSLMIDYTRVGIAYVPEWKPLESWTDSVSTGAEWQVVDLWTDVSRAVAQWRPIDSWSGTLSVSAWWSLDSWSCTSSVFPAIWQPIEGWEIMVHARVEWCSIDSWSGTISARVEWNIAESWTNTIGVPVSWQFVESWIGEAGVLIGWLPMETWIRTVYTFAFWQSVDSFVGTTQAPITPHLVESWVGEINTPVEWRPVDFWVSDVRTPLWQLIETWDVEVSAPVVWQAVEIWVNTIGAPAAWQPVESCTGQISSSAAWQLIDSWHEKIGVLVKWQEIDLWMGVVQSPARWNSIDSWVNTFITFASWHHVENWVAWPTISVAWQFIETWSETVTVPVEWNLIEAWLGNIATSAYWQSIESWTGSVLALPLWRTIESWDVIIEAPVKWKVVDSWINILGSIREWRPIEAWSASVRVLDFTPPPSPQLISPDNGTMTADNTPTFDWSDVYDPSGVTYDFEIVNVFIKVGLIQSSYTLEDSEALPDGTYYWRVRAVDGAGNVGNWSETRLLYVQTRAKVKTMEATNVMATQATLNASIWYGVYSSVDIRFQFRVKGTKNWLSSAWEENWTNTAYSYTLFGLSPFTTYEFRSHIKFDNEEEYGDVLEFTTKAVFIPIPLPPPPQPITYDLEVTALPKEVPQGRTVTIKINVYRVAGGKEPVDITTTLTIMRPDGNQYAKWTVTGAIVAKNYEISYQTSEWPLGRYVARVETTWAGGTVSGEDSFEVVKPPLIERLIKISWFFVLVALLVSAYSLRNKFI